MEKPWSVWGPEKYVTGEFIQEFADLTNNHQWIHEESSCSADGPYGWQIAHGLLVLALVPGLLPDDGALPVHTLRVIRGIERLRFPSPVYPRNMVRVRVRRLKEYQAPSGKGVVIEREVEVWAKKGKKPALSCVLKLQYF